MSTSNVNGNSKSRTIPLSLCLTLVFAAATGAWALSTEVHNDRLSNLSGRVKAHEDLLMVHDRAIATSTAQYTHIMASIDRLLEKDEDGG